MNTRESRASYIGVSGVVDQDQQRSLEHLARHYKLTDPEATRSDSRLSRSIALGVKAVHNTQWLDRPNKYGPSWYPVGATSFARAVHASTPDETLNVAQVYMDPTTIAADPTYADAFIEQILERGEAWVDALQFDMLPYHDDTLSTDWPALMERIHQRTNNRVETILQCHSPAMSRGPKAAVERLKKFGSTVDRVLFDASHGTGREMNGASLRTFLDAAYSDRDLAATSFGIAGGLNTERVQKHLPAIVRQFPDISWDAEGQLHKPFGELDRGLDMDKVRGYLAASAKVLDARI
jgi:phosphoribosylanthranilate isomerase